MELRWTRPIDAARGGAVPSLPSTAKAWHVLAVLGKPLLAPIPE